MEENWELKSRRPRKHQWPYKPKQNVRLTFPIPREETSSAVSTSVDSINPVVQRLPSLRNFLSNEIAMQIESDSSNNSQPISLSAGISLSPQKLYLVKKPSSKFIDLTEYLQVNAASESYELEERYLNDNSLFLDSNNKLYILNESSKDSLNKTPHYYFDDTQQDLGGQQLPPFISSDDRIKVINSNFSDEYEKDIITVSCNKSFTMDDNLNNLDSQTYHKNPIMKQEQCLQNQGINRNTLYLRSSAINQAELLSPKYNDSAMDLENSDAFKLQLPIDPTLNDLDPIIEDDVLLGTPNSIGTRILSTYQNNQGRYFMCDTCVFKSQSIQEITDHVMKFNEQGILCTFSEYGVEDVVDGRFQADCRKEDYSQSIRNASMFTGISSSNIKREKDVAEERDNIKVIPKVQLKTNLYPESFSPVQYQCNICSYICDLENDLRLHILKHTIPKTNLGKYNWRSKNNAKNISQKYKLDKSNVSTVQDKNTTKQETESQTNSEIFKHKTNRNNVTIRKNHGEKKKTYKITKCNFKLPKKSSIDKQKLLQNIYKTFECNKNEYISTKNYTIKESLLMRSKTKS